MNFCSWNTGIQAEGKHGLGVGWAGSREDANLGGNSQWIRHTYVGRALGSGAKGLDSHMVLGKSLPF